MKRYITILIFSLSLAILGAAPVSASDFKFLIDREQYQYIQKYHEDFAKLLVSELESERRVALEYAQKTEQPELAMDIHYSLARDFGCLEDALQWLLLAESLEIDSLRFAEQGTLLKSRFTSAIDSLVYINYLEPESGYLPLIQIVDVDQRI
ncbi:MAG TPA: hypothetical protein PKI59_02585, partial [Candidatus Cloacimonadota bacterium]|nr:hypothetical protein [Candidatus Cloacimonadota bacterium]